MIIQPKNLQLGLYEKPALEFLEYFAINRESNSPAHIEKIAHLFGTLPYENLSKIIKLYHHSTDDPYRMPDELYEGYRRSRLGGTCFSLTYYLLEILTFCGYSAFPVLGDMKWGKNVHSAVLVLMDNREYLVDPGYLIHKPLRLSKDTITRHIGTHSGIEIRFNEEIEQHDLYTFRSGNFTWRYRFSPTPVSMKDLAYHWGESFYKPTLNGICLTRTTDSEMIYVHNDYVKISGADFTTKENSRDLSQHIIANQFGIDLQILEEARMALKTNRDRENKVPDQ